VSRKLNDWYGKYGFRPYDPEKNTSDEKLSKIYKKNKQLVNKTKIEDTNLFVYLGRIVREKSKGDKVEEKRAMAESKRMFGKMTIREFFRYHFFEDFQETCGTLSKFYLNFAEDNSIYDFHGKSFYLDI
jgi:hypothetical protein